MKAKNDGRSDLAVLIGTRLEDISSRKSQREVALEVGFPSTNIISILKRGATKLSLDRVEKMAKALDLDLATVMIPALRQYYDDDVIEALRNTFQSDQTKTEREILALARKNMDTSQPLSFDMRERLKKVFQGEKE